MVKRWTWRPRDQRAIQNEEILDAVAHGEARRDIAARLGITANTVTGVIARARAAGDTRAAVLSMRMVRQLARKARLAELALRAAGNRSRAAPRR